MSLDALYAKYVEDCVRFGWGKPADFYTWLQVTKRISECPPE